MYDYIEGILAHIYPNAIVVDCHGVGYLIQIANPFTLSNNQSQKIKIYIHQAVREDAITLYGFQTVEEKQLFLKLISVSGIGPKSALSILANGDMDGLVNAIETDNSTYLTKFPGVGKKTAGQLILDLKGKVGTVGNVAQPIAVNYNPILDEATQGLLGLGYSQKEIQKIMPTLEKETFEDTSSALRMAFKLLLKTK